ncbi:MAG: hypothetical protein Q4C59_08685 [Lachnospiraceae bacterium]|nr:hypothetical protein [Lachnospiraceae bacterium]
MHRMGLIMGVFLTAVYLGANCCVMAGEVEIPATMVSDKIENRETQLEETEEMLSESEEIMQEFLTVFFSINQENRIACLEDGDVETYLEPFQALTTEECLEQMGAGRLPSKYDKLLSEDYESVEVEEIELDHYADNTYEYTVQLSLLSGDNVVETSVTGQIGIDDGKKIYNIYVKEEKGFIDSLAGEKD